MTIQGGGPKSCELSDPRPSRNTSNGIAIRPVGSSRRRSCFTILSSDGRAAGNRDRYADVAVLGAVCPYASRVSAEKVRHLRRIDPHLDSGPFGSLYVGGISGGDGRAVVCRAGSGLGADRGHAIGGTVVLTARNRARGTPGTKSLVLLVSATKELGCLWAHRLRGVKHRTLGTSPYVVRPAPSTRVYRLAAILAARTSSLYVSDGRNTADGRTRVWGMGRFPYYGGTNLPPTASRVSDGRAWYCLYRLGYWIGAQFQGPSKSLKASHAHPN